MAYKSFTNGFPLPASDLNNFLMDQSVITFASSTERDSTLTAPKEGMLTYLQDTDTYTWYDGSAWQDLVGSGAIEETLLTTTGDVIYASAAETAARLGIGSEGEVLTVSSGVPAWSAPAAAGSSWTQLATGSLTTGVSEMSITGFAAYDKYYLNFKDAKVNSPSASIGSTFYFQLNNETLAYDTSSAGISALGSFTHQLSRAGSQNFITVANYGDGAYGGANANLFISGAQSSGYKHVIHNGGAYENTGDSITAMRTGQSIWTSTDVLTSIEIGVNWSTISAGTYTLYGSN